MLIILGVFIRTNSERRTIAVMLIIQLVFWGFTLCQVLGKKSENESEGIGSKSESERVSPNGETVLTKGELPKGEEINLQRKFGPYERKNMYPKRYNFEPNTLQKINVMWMPKGKVGYSKKNDPLRKYNCLHRAYVSSSCRTRRDALSQDRALSEHYFAYTKPDQVYRHDPKLTKSIKRLPLSTADDLQTNDKSQPNADDLHSNDKPESNTDDVSYISKPLSNTDSHVLFTKRIKYPTNILLVPTYPATNLQLDLRDGEFQPLKSVYLKKYFQHKFKDSGLQLAAHPAENHQLGSEYNGYQSQKPRQNPQLIPWDGRLQPESFFYPLEILELRPEYNEYKSQKLIYPLTVGNDRVQPVSLVHPNLQIGAEHNEYQSEESVHPRRNLQLAFGDSRVQSLSLIHPTRNVQLGDGYNGYHTQEPVYPTGNLQLIFGDGRVQPLNVIHTMGNFQLGSRYNEYHSQEPVYPNGNLQQPISRDRRVQPLGLIHPMGNFQLGTAYYEIQSQEPVYSRRNLQLTFGNGRTQPTSIIHPTVNLQLDAYYSGYQRQEPIYPKRNLQLIFEDDRLQPQILDYPIGDLQLGSAYNGSQFKKPMYLIYPIGNLQLGNGHKEFQFMKPVHLTRNFRLHSDDIGSEPLYLVYATPNLQSAVEHKGFEFLKPVFPTQDIQFDFIGDGLQPLEVHLGENLHLAFPDDIFCPSGPLHLGTNLVLNTKTDGKKCSLWDIVFRKNCIPLCFEKNIRRGTINVANITVTEECLNRPLTETGSYETDKDLSYLSLLARSKNSRNRIWIDISKVLPKERNLTISGKLLQEVFPMKKGRTNFRQMTFHKSMSIGADVAFELNEEDLEADHAQQPSNRIIGGTVTDIKYCPYQVAIIEKNEFICGGAIIGEKHVLTAAHCFEDTKIPTLLVKTGISSLIEDGKEYSVKTVFVHENYVPSDNDIALVLLQRSISFGPKVQKIPLPPSNYCVKVGDPVSISGFGSTGVDEKGSENIQLYQIQLNLTSRKNCRKRKLKSIAFRGIFNRQICTESPLHHGTCYGDSGGPMVHDGFLIGIISWGSPCAIGDPDVFTNVSYFLSWIYKKMQETN